MTNNEDIFIAWVLVFVWLSVPAMFAAGCHQLAQWHHQRARYAAYRDQYRLELYRVAGSIARRRVLSDRMAALKRARARGHVLDIPTLGEGVK